MPPLTARVKEEVRKLLIAAIFFSVGFLLLILHNRLLTLGSGIEIAGVTRALVGGLIVAKVLLTVDLLPFVDAFPNKPLVYNITWKSLLYITGSIVFLYLEPLVKNLFKGAGLYLSHSRAWQEVMVPRTASIAIWLAVLMTGFVTIRELSRVIGKAPMKDIFLGRRSKPVTEIRSRDAA